MWPRSWSGCAPIEVKDTIRRVTRTEPEVFDAYGEEKHLVAVMDYGVKQNIIECLRRRGCKVAALPAYTPASEVLSSGFDGVMLSNGPGDPAENTEHHRRAAASSMTAPSPSSASAWATSFWPWPPAPRQAGWPMATGAATTPSGTWRTERVFITSQNHGYMVLSDTVDPAVAEVSHINVNDGTCEGLKLQAPQLLYHSVPSRGQRRPQGYGIPLQPLYRLHGRCQVMPKYTDIKKVLVLGSGPIVIGQAAEFDYAGTQACRALKEEGLEVVLINSNPATIMTDKDIADHVYIEPHEPALHHSDH